MRRVSVRGSVTHLTLPLGHVLFGDLAAEGVGDFIVGVDDDVVARLGY